MSNLVSKYYNFRCKKSSNNKILQSLKNANINILAMIQIKSISKNKLIKFQAKKKKIAKRLIT